MAFDLSKFHIRIPETHLYIASWGNDQLVNHDYKGDIGLKPLVFGSGEQKVGLDRHYAYHIDQNGSKHGVEELMLPDGTEATVYSAISLMKKFTNFFTEKYGLKKPVFSKGEMSNEYNVVYADYDGIKIGVHVARPDGLNASGESIWFTIRQGETWAKRFSFMEKKTFIKECRAVLAQ